MDDVHKLVVECTTDLPLASQLSTLIFVINTATFKTEVKKSQNNCPSAAAI